VLIDPYRRRLPHEAGRAAVLGANFQPTIVGIDDIDFDSRLDAGISGEVSLGPL
jgi:hypothetical protein